MACVDQTALDRFIYGSPEKELTRGLLRKRLGEQAQRWEILVNRFNSEQIMWDRLGKGNGLKFLDAFSKGKVSEADMEKLFPGQGKFFSNLAKEHRAIYDYLHDLVTSSGAKVHYYEDYWPGLFKNPDKARSWILGKLRKNPGYAKEKFYKTVQDALDAGLELRFDNPVDLLLARAFQGFQHKMTLDFIGDLKQHNLIKFVRTGQAPPEGFSRISGDRLKVFFPTEKGIVVAGDYYAVDPAAKMINNWLSPSLWSNPKWYGKLFRGVMYMKNAFVSTILSLSGFHFVETYASGVAVRMSMGVREAARGNYIRGIRQIVGSWVEPVWGVATVGDVIRAWKTGKYRNEYERLAVQMMREANFRPEMSNVWELGAKSHFRTAYRKWLQGDKIAALVRAVPAAIEAVSYPLMKFWVPRLKTHAFLELAGEYFRVNPGVDAVRRRQMLAKIADNVDNRFGQLIYENLFVNRYFRDIAIGSTLSLGWNLGTYREFGGAVADVGRLSAALLKKDVSITDLLQGVDRGKVNANIDRIMYSTIYPFVVFATVGSILHYAMTGEAPKSLLDRFYPKTGRKNPDGSDERFQMPTMVKEFFNATEAWRKYGITKGTYEYLNHKVNPLVANFLDLVIDNKNYWGAEIIDPDAPLSKKAEQIAEFVYDQIKPISVRSFERHKEITGEESLLPFAGFTVARPFVSRTDAQNKIYDLYTKRFPRTFSTIEADKIQKRREVKMLIFKGKYVEAKQRFIELRKEGIIKRTRWGTYLRLYSMPSDVRAFRALPVEDQDKVWELATEEEKRKYMPYYKALKGTGRRRRSRSRIRLRR